MFRQISCACALSVVTAGCALPSSKTDDVAAPPQALLKPPALAKTPRELVRRSTSISRNMKNLGGKRLAIPRVITLPVVYRLVLERSPDLARTYLNVRREEARILQAGLIPNPEVEVEPAANACGVFL